MTAAATPRQRLVPLVPALAAACLATACALPGMSAAPLVGSEWRLDAIGDARALERAPATLAFPEAGRVAGQGSCNRFFGSYTLMSDRIAFGQLGSTRMACLDAAVGEQEARYLDALQKAERVEVEGATMRLHVRGMAQPLRFTRTKP